MVPQVGNGKAFSRGVAAEHLMYVIRDLLLWSRALVTMDTSTWQEVVWLFSVTQVAGMSGGIAYGFDIKKKTNRKRKKNSWQVGWWAYRGAQL